MSETAVASTEEAYAERWRQWQLANVESSLNSAVWARILFAVIFIALAGWLGLSLSARLGI